MKLLSKRTLVSAALATLLAVPAIASVEDEHKNVKIKIMAGVNQISQTETFYGESISGGSEAFHFNGNLIGYGIALEYEFTPILGMELRHYFGGERKKLPEASNLEYATIENATTLMLTAQSPEIFGLSAYLQAGPALVKNDDSYADISNKSLAYGGGIEYAIDDNKTIFIDALEFSKAEYVNVDEELDVTLKTGIQNRMVTFGFMMKF